jgi:hypothetical protein
MSGEKTYEGRCFCGAVQLRVTGAPAAMGYCHCTSCREWSAGPVNAFALWKTSAVEITKGAELIGTYNKTPQTFRKWCTKCGGHVLTDHPPFDMIDVYAAITPALEFVPSVHVYYAETTLRIRDGLPKMKDMPAAMGGSGETLPE